MWNLLPALSIHQINKADFFFKVFFTVLRSNKHSKQIWVYKSLLNDIIKSLTNKQTIFCPNNKKNPVVSHKPSLQEELPLDFMIPPPPRPPSQRPLQLRVISSSSPSFFTLISVALSDEYYFPSVCLLHTGVYRHGNFTEMLHRPGFFLFFPPLHCLPRLRGKT